MDAVGTEERRLEIVKFILERGHVLHLDGQGSFQSRRRALRENRVVVGVGYLVGAAMLVGRHEVVISCAEVDASARLLFRLRLQRSTILFQPPAISTACYS